MRQMPKRVAPKPFRICGCSTPRLTLARREASLDAEAGRAGAVPHLWMLHSSIDFNEERGILRCRSGSRRSRSASVDAPLLD
jgi:hypothetical protein